MPKSKFEFGPRRLAVACVLVMGIVFLIGAVIWYRPFLLSRPEPVAATPTPTALFVVSEFPVPARGQACMDLVTVTPQSRIAYFLLRPPKPVPGGGPPVELRLSAPGYQGSVSVPGGYGGGAVDLPVTPPPAHPVVATACFINKGGTTVLFDGTTEARTLARSHVEINGRQVPGDIALTFFATYAHRVIGRLPTMVQRASNLTDGFLSPWMLWIIVVSVAVGVPIAVASAFYDAVRDDATTAG